ncbi:MAG: hypothetical protein AXA67_04480 [Methylothermaceae bacteria B42]|nr:MAG: hypothetical protein AXA67_04480 [Methylothermaceae bacteria B42]HHJ39944.1 DUF4340 domain-containing protein [Methylothermaceae bacterium]
MLGSRWLLNLFLLIAIAGLGVWVYWLEKKPEAPQTTLLDLNPEAIDAIVIQKQKGRIELRKQGDHWQMTRPYQARVDSYQIEQLLSLPKQTSQAQYPASEATLSNFGLSPPKVTVILGETRIDFGNTQPIDGRRYVRVGDTLHLIDDSVFPLLTARASDWVTRKLLPSDEIRALTLPGWKIRLSEKGTWRSEPEASQETLAQFVDTWRQARAIQVSPLKGKPKSASETITVQLKDQTLKWIIQQQEPELILLDPRQKLRYHFYGSSGKKLLAPELPKANGKK